MTLFLAEVRSILATWSDEPSENSACVVDPSIRSIDLCYFSSVSAPLLELTTMISAVLKKGPV